MDDLNTSNRRGILLAGGALTGALSLHLTDTAAMAQGVPAGTAGPSVSARIVGQRDLGTGPARMTVSALGSGVMGMDHDRGIHPDREASIRLLHQAVERGVTLFDTAQVYGPFTNEKLAGDALRPFRGKVAVTTKFGYHFVDGKQVPGVLNSRPENIRQVAEESLRALHVDSIDLFYQHRVDPNVPIEDVAGAVRDLIRQGKVRRFGLSEASARTIRRAHAVQPLTAVQSEYHLMWREPELKIFPVLEELGIGFVPYSPINRAFLAGTITEATNFAGGNDNRASSPRFQPEAIRANLRIVEALNAFGRARGMTAAQVALAWHLAKRPWIVPIPGTTKLSNLEENLRTSDFTLTQEDVRTLETAIEAMPVVGDRYLPDQQKMIDAS